MGFLQVRSGTLGEERRRIGATKLLINVDQCLTSGSEFPLYASPGSQLLLKAHSVSRESIPQCPASSQVASLQLHPGSVLQSQTCNPVSQSSSLEVHPSHHMHS